MFCAVYINAKHKESIPATKGLQLLKEGNAGFVQSKSQHKNQSKEKITETSKGQYLFAIIVGCSDSRVSPEILFDQGLGDLLENSNLFS